MYNSVKPPNISNGTAIYI